MTPTDARAALVAAVRRDLFGPLGSDDPAWPGAEPKVIAPGATFDAWRDVKGAFVDLDGNEVLTSSPLRRYGIGVLFPAGFSGRLEEELDAAQSDSAEEAADYSAEDPATTAELGPPPVAPEAGGVLHAESDDAAETDAPFRPRSMAVSFLLHRSTALRVALTGASYEPFSVSVAGESAAFWRRQPVNVETTFDPSSGQHDQTLSAGALQLRIGTVVRPHTAGILVTVYALNITQAGRELPASTAAALFQSNLRVITEADAVSEYPTPSVLEGHDRSLELLYHRESVRSMGHGCNSTYSRDEGSDIVEANHFPVETVHSPIPDAVDKAGNVLAVDMDELSEWSESAVAGVNNILDAYSEWIDAREHELDRLPSHLRATGVSHLAACRAFLEGASEGWRLASQQSDVALVLRWTSEAMAHQRRAYAASTRPLRFDASGKKVLGAEGKSPHDPSGRAAARWRAFQIAFLLASLPGVVDSAKCAHRTVDIIWMPTGGGKTEAYSGVAAFTMLWRRLGQVRANTPLGGQGAAVLMRYTLRLLTAQQLQRAASLMCALEVIRRANPGQLGDKRKFTIGAWLGRRSTPNDWSGARVALRDWRADPTKRGFLLTRCPWCAAAIGRRSGTGQREIDGYRAVPAPGSSESRVMSYCPDPACPFSHESERPAATQGLPVYEVDADLYKQPPTFIVGTVDKFAMLAWRTEPAAFFGLKADRRTGPGPALLIQDELHLISGPLGSLDALYEPVIEDLCSRESGSPPKVIASTATTRRYMEQTRALYGRPDTRLIPPPGLDTADNFFSRVSATGAGKTFVGICAPGFGRAQEAQIRIIAALGHAAGGLDAAGIEPDPWWTNLMFFSSRRSLGLVQSLVQTHLRSHSWRLHRATGVDAGPARATGHRATVRAMTRRVELSAQATSDVSEAMDRLAIPKAAGASPDLCFATSMIEVGIDIDRLGLLTMFGQPKSASQYIQVAGRVGRDERSAPGVVFVVLNTFNPRDRSHFEQFSTFHRRLYASVEPVSITPFTPAALERGLAGALTSWVRQAKNPITPADAQAQLSEAREVIAARLGTGDIGLERLRSKYDELVMLLNATTHEEWGTLRPGAGGEGFLRSLGDAVAARADSPEALNTQWLVPTSMRSVDAEAGARAIHHMRSPSATVDRRRDEGRQANPEEDII